jgi:restriction system protein
VQALEWQAGVDKVRELRGVMASHDIKRGQFATTSEFSQHAEEFAAKNGINLLNGRGLLALIRQRSEAQQAMLLEIALEGEYHRPTCVNCGTKMVERTPKGGGRAFWGCQNYPRCRKTMPMRSV